MLAMTRVSEAEGAHPDLHRLDTSDAGSIDATGAGLERGLGGRAPVVWCLSATSVRVRGRRSEN
jgi:hypothetical protein